MTAVTYTANSGYKFPATSSYYTTTNGIKVERTSDTVVTVSGTPNGVANVTVPDAMAIVASVTSNGTTTNYTDFDTALTNWTDGSTLTLLADVTITSSITVDSGTKTLDLNGHGILLTGSGSVIKVTGGNLTMTDSAQVKPTHYITLDANGRGTAVNDSSSAGAVQVNGGYVTGSNTLRGGGVRVDSGSFTMSGGSITGNISEYGGGVFVNSGCSFTMSGGSITSNTASRVNGYGNGGGVYVYMGSFTMSGGNITGNTAKISGGGVSVFGAFSISGAPTIKNNNNDTETNNVYLHSNKTITVIAALTNTDSIGVTMENSTGVFTNTASDKLTYNDASKFKSDNTSYKVGKNAAGQMVLGVPCTVTYDGNGATGGSVPTDSNTYANGSSVTVLAKESLARDGYTFAGWKIGTGATIYANSADNITSATGTFTINGNTTLTAQWDALPATAPRISSEPQNLRLTYGYTAGSVNVTATAATDTTYGNLAYQWYSCDSDGNNGTAINVSTEPTAATSAYTIPTGKTVEQSPLYYYCVVTATRADNGLTATVPSRVVKVTINRLNETAPTNDEAKAQLNIDYQNETISTKPGYELAADNQGTRIANFSSILDDVTPTVCVRKSPTSDNHAPSDWVEVTLAARPAEPTGLGSTNATSGSSADGTITGVDSTMEYSSDNGASWNPITATPITGLNPGSYSVRVKATDNAPHGKPTEVIVGNKVGINLTDDQKPTAKTDLVFTGSEQQLINAPVNTTLPQGATEIQYALGTDATNPPSSGWSTSIPTATNGGTYFVWYKVVGGTNYNDTEPVCLTVEITFTVTFDPNEGSGNMNQVRVRGRYELPANEFTAPEGNVFAHWEIDGNQYAAGDTINVSDNLTVQAVWVETNKSDTKIKKSDLTVVPAELINLYPTVQAIRNELFAKLFAIGSAVSQNQTKLYDVKLMISNDNGRTWVEADVNNFPTGGLDVVLDYPEGTGPNGWVFGVSHMFTQTVPRLGTTAGNVETPPVTKTPDGLRVKLKGLSPVMISWQKEEVAADPNSLPQTGDKSNVLIYALIGALAVTGIVFLAKRKRI